jgi:hypothetical protein
VYKECDEPWNTSFDNSIAFLVYRSCLNQPSLTLPSEAVWARGMREYLGTRAQLDNADRNAVAETPQVVESHQADVKSYARGASKTSLKIELMFKSGLSEPRNLAHWHVREVTS